MPYHIIIALMCYRLRVKVIVSIIRQLPAATWYIVCRNWMHKISKLLYTTVTMKFTVKTVNDVINDEVEDALTRVRNMSNIFDV